MSCAGCLGSSLPFRSCLTTSGLLCPLRPLRRCLTVMGRGWAELWGGGVGWLDCWTTCALETSVPSGLSLCARAPSFSLFRGAFCFAVLLFSVGQLLASFWSCLLGAVSGACLVLWSFLSWGVFLPLQLPFLPFFSPFLGAPLLFCVLPSLAC